MDATEKMGYSISFAGYRRENGHIFPIFTVTNGKTSISGFKNRADALNFIDKMNINTYVFLERAKNHKK